MICTHPDGYQPYDVMVLESTGRAYAIWQCADCGQILNDLTIPEVTAYYGTEMSMRLVEDAAKRLDTANTNR